MQQNEVLENMWMNVKNDSESLVRLVLFVPKRGDMTADKLTEVHPSFTLSI